MYQVELLTLTYLVPFLCIASLIGCCVAIACIRSVSSKVWRLVCVALIAAVVVYAFWYFGWCESWLRLARACRWGRTPSSPPATYDVDEQPVGGAWSFVLNKRAPHGRVVYTHRWRGRLPDGWWGAGTTIAQLQAELAVRGESVSSHPSVNTATLGGWIFSNSHGSGGNLWRRALGRVRVHDRANNEVFEATPKQLFSARHTVASQRRYVILAVRIDPVPNVWVEQTAFRACTIRDLEHFLKTPSYLRLITVGARGSLALLWSPQTTAHLSTGSWKNGRILQWLQADALAIYGSANGACDDDAYAWFSWPVMPPAEWHCRVRLSDASNFTPLPYAYLLGLCLLYQNFELFIDIPVTPQLLDSTLRELEREFALRPGRCEVRCGTRRLYLDMSIPSCQSPFNVCAAVERVVGTHPVYLHKGKAQVDIRPLKNSVG